VCSPLQPVWELSLYRFQSYYAVSIAPAAFLYPWSTGIPKVGLISATGLSVSSAAPTRTDIYDLLMLCRLECSSKTTFLLVLCTPMGAHFSNCASALANLPSSSERIEGVCNESQNGDPITGRDPSQFAVKREARSRLRTTKIASATIFTHQSQC
jgi:hypothetical protein